MKRHLLKFSSVIFALSTLSLSGQIYWDINGAAAGAGGVTPSGTWNTSIANWTADSAGAAAGQVWADGNVALFAADTDASGTYTVTVSGTQAPAGLTFEEGTVTLSGGTLNVSGSIDVAAGLTATIGSALSGSALLSKLSTGVLVLSDASPAYTPLAPGFSVVQGILQMGASGAILSNAPVTLSTGASLDLNNLSVGIGSVGGAGNVTLGSGTLTNHGVTANSTLTGVISGSGSGVGIVKAGANTWTLNNSANSFTSKILITGGVLAVPNDGSLGAVPGSPVADQITIINGATLQLQNSAVSIPANRGIALGAVGGVVSVNSSQTIAISANITGPGDLVKANSGNATLWGTNTFAGTFTITGGGVRFNTDIAAGTGSIIVSPASSVFLRNLGPTNSVSTVTNSITVNAGVGFVDLNAVSADTFILSGPISGAGPMLRGQQAGSSGRVVLAGDNSGWSGGLTLWRGKVGLGHKNALGTTALLIRPATFAAGNDAVLLAWTPLTGPNAVVTPVNIDITNAAAHFAFGGTNALELSGAIDLGSTTTPIINVTNTGVTILSGIIGGGAGVGLTKNGLDTLTLRGANTYSGVTTINAGTLLVNAPGSLASGGVIVNSGGTLGGSGTINGAVTVSSGGGVGAGASAGTLTMASGLNLSVGGTNIWELANNSTSIAGVDFDQIVVTGGNLVLGGSSALQIKFTGSATSPLPSEPFWQVSHSWKIISLSGGAANPGSTTFSSLLGTNGIIAGTFSISVDAAGVYLNYTSNLSPKPTITSVMLASPNFILQGTNGFPGGSYSVLTSTNVGLPLAGWTTNATGNFNGVGAFSNGIPINAGDPQRFFLIKQP